MSELAPESRPSVLASALGTRSRLSNARAALAGLNSGELQMVLADHMRERHGARGAAAVLMGVAHDCEAGAWGHPLRRGNDGAAK